jgi:prepilin-type processing-associated H-X9-DG protein
LNVTKYNFVAALIALVAIGLLASCEKAASLAGRQNCRQQLRSLWSAVTLYRQDHTNQWPETLESLDRKMVGRLLACPGVKTNSDPGGQSDYIYVDWSKPPHDPKPTAGQYPLLYDRHTGNHEGHGINVLMVDGSVMWDSNAQWLKKFDVVHPNAKLPIPD